GDVPAKSAEGREFGDGPCGDGAGGFAGAGICHVRFVRGAAADDHAALAQAGGAAAGGAVEHFPFGGGGGARSGYVERDGGAATAGADGRGLPADDRAGEDPGDVVRVDADLPADGAARGGSRWAVCRRVRWRTIRAATGG